MQVAVDEDLLDRRFTDVVLGDQPLQVVGELSQPLRNPAGRIGADDPSGHGPHLRPHTLDNAVPGTSESRVDPQYEHMFGDATAPVRHDQGFGRPYALRGEQWSPRFQMPDRSACGGAGDPKAPGSGIWERAQRAIWKRAVRAELELPT